MYTFRKTVVDRPAAANGKRDGPMLGLCRKNDSNTVVFTPTHAPGISVSPNDHKMFCEYIFFFVIYAFSGVWMEEKRQRMENWKLSCVAVTFSPTQLYSVSSGCREWLWCSGPFSKTGLPRVIDGADSEAQDENWEGNWVFGGINNPEDGLLSYCYRAKILITLWILTVIAEHVYWTVCLCSYLYVWEVVCAQM